MQKSITVCRFPLWSLGLGRFSCLRGGLLTVAQDETSLEPLALVSNMEMIKAWIIVSRSSFDRNRHSLLGKWNCNHLLPQLSLQSGLSVNLIQPHDYSPLSCSGEISFVEGTVNITDSSFQCFSLTYFSL